MGYRVAVVGATGNVGREMLNVLHERNFPADEVIALASRRSIGTEVSYGDATLKCNARLHRLTGTMAGFSQPGRARGTTICRRAALD